MRRIDPLQQERLNRAGIKRWRRGVLRRSKRHVPAQRITISPPKILSFSKNFRETIDFLNRMRDETLLTSRVRKSVYVDLVPLAELSVPVAIVLAAEFHRWSLHRGAKLIPRNTNRWSPSVRYLMADLGVFDLLKTRAVDPGDEAIKNFTLSPLESGERFDGKKIDELQSHFALTLKSFTTQPSLFEGLMEAAENAISHAYPDEYVPQHPYAGHRWWGASCLDLEEMRLRFFIFDQGAGIPFTLPRGPLSERIRQLLADATGGYIHDDAEMLKAAFEIGRSRTGLGYRGLGLQRMADVVKGSKSGFLRILSGRAEIKYKSDDHIVTKALPSHIGGTLIEWSLPADIFGVVEESNGDAND